MQGNEKPPQEISSSSIVEKIDYHSCESQSLLLLEARQIVHHMLIVEDWIVLAIETPHSHPNNNKTNFSKIKQSNHSTQHNQFSFGVEYLQSITRFVSVMAIRTVDSIIDLSHQLYNKSNKQGHSSSTRIPSQNSCKSSIGEIKMLHKQCRLQNILPWTVPSYVLSKTPKNKSSTFTLGIDKQSINSQLLQYEQQDSISTTDTKHFIILTYTRIELYTIQQNISSSSITLSGIFQTPFLIPFNVVWLSNQTQMSNNKSLNRLSNKSKTNVSFQIRFKPHSTFQPFQIAISGIDRSQTFWSGYYEIQNQKRNIYLFRDFFLRPKNISSSHRVQKSFRSPQAKLRRVKSAENIFHLKNNLSPLKQDKQKLLSTEHFTKQSVTSSNKQSIPFQITLSPSRQDLTKKLLQFKQSLPNELISRMQNNRINQIKKKQKSQKIIPKELEFDERIEIYPKLITLNKSLNDEKNNLCPPLQYFSHFYIQTTAQHQHHHLDSRSKIHKHIIQINKSHKNIKCRIKFDLFLLVSYANSIGLVNTARKELVSKVELQPTVSVTSITRISSLFGIHSVVVLAKDFYNVSQKGKAIKVTIDNISKDKLGIGLEKLKIPTISSFEQIVHIDDIWQQRLIDEINDIIEECEDENGKFHFFNGSFQVDKDLIRQSVMENDMQEHLQDRIEEDHEANNLLSQFQHWRNIPLNEMKYNLLMVTDKGRVLLYNHIRSSVQQIYSSQDHNNYSQNLSVKKMPQVHASKFYLHFKQAVNSSQQQNFNLQLRLKLAAIFNKQVIPQGIKQSISTKSNNLNDQKSHSFFPVAQLKQLKQILLFDNNSM